MEDRSVLQLIIYIPTLWKEQILKWTDSNSHCHLVFWLPNILLHSLDYRKLPNMLIWRSRYLHYTLKLKKQHRSPLIKTNIIYRCIFSRNQRNLFDLSFQVNVTTSTPNDQHGTDIITDPIVHSYKLFHTDILVITVSTNSQIFILFNAMWRIHNLKSKHIQ